MRKTFKLTFDFLGEKALSQDYDFSPQRIYICIYSKKANAYHEADTVGTGNTTEYKTDANCHYCVSRIIVFTLFFSVVFWYSKNKCLDGCGRRQCDPMHAFQVIFMSPLCP